MSLYLGNQLVSGVATPTEPTRNLGQIIESIVPLTDAGLHLLDGALINGSGIYSAFVDAIADLVTDYPDLFETEANWQSAVTTYGVCGKFVYDDVNNTVRLPKITGIVEGTTDTTALGDLVEAGLPNITGSYHDSRAWVDSGATGAFTGSATVGSGGADYYSSAYNSTIKFDASKSSSIYGNSNTVQPQTIKALYYIVIATTTKTEIEVDINQIATDLNGKADVDLSNINASQSAKNTIINWGLPDYSAGVTISALPFTAPIDCYAFVTYIHGNGGSIVFNVNNAPVQQWGYNSTPYYTERSCVIYLHKGDVLSQNDAATLVNGAYYPLKGAN